MTIWIVLYSVIGIFMSIFLFGYVWTWAIWPDRTEASSLQRVSLGFGLSILLQPLLWFVLYTFFRVPLSDVYIYLVQFISLIIALTIYAIRRFKK